MTLKRAFFLFKQGAENAKGVMGIQEALERINSEDQLQQLYGIFYSIKDYEIPIVRHTMYPGSSLIRQRINVKGKAFCHIAELSYPPAAVTPMERANLPGHPMFYACSFPSMISEGAPIPRVIALEETSSFMKDKTASGIERATVSRWDLTEKIELIALPYTGTYERACPDLVQIKQGWLEAINQGIVPQDALDLVHYMAEEISKDFTTRDRYFKIANFVNYLLTINSKTKDADGIIYPSVPAQGAGFNVAIKPEVADTKIVFVGASICHLLKREDKMSVLPMSDAVVDKFGNMIFVDRFFSKAEVDFYREKSDGLSFVN